MILNYHKTMNKYYKLIHIDGLSVSISRNECGN